MTRQEVFQHNLPYIRKILGISCGDLADCIGIPREAIKSYEQRGLIKDKTKLQLLYYACSTVCEHLVEIAMDAKVFVEYMELTRKPVDPDDPKWKEVKRGV